MRIKYFFIFLLSMLVFCNCNADQSPLMRLATTEWPPYVVKDSKEHGFISEIITTIFHAQGYQTEINFLPWKEALVLTKNGNDAFYPAYERPERKDIVCSDAIYSGPVALFKRKDSDIKFSADPTKNEWQALRNLRQYRFGVVEGYVNTKIFDRATFLNKQTAHSDLANLQQLKEGKVQLIVADVFVALELINRHKPEFDNIEMMSPSLEQKKDYLCFSTTAPNYSAKLNAFNQGLQELKRSGELDEIVARYGK